MRRKSERECVYCVCMRERERERERECVYEREREREREVNEKVFCFFLDASINV